MTHYTRGYAFERKVSALLRERGWITTEARGSHGAWDIVASRGTWLGMYAGPCELLLIQCKTGAGKCSPAERAALNEAARKGGAEWYLANSPKRGEIQFWHWRDWHEHTDVWVAEDTDALLGERSPESKWRREGWGWWPGNPRKTHYVRQARSLCGRQGCCGFLEPDRPVRSNDCKQCRKLREAEKERRGDAPGAGARDA